jgi:hypothetical protein
MSDLGHESLPNGRGQACKAWRECVCVCVCECPCQKQACKAWRECVCVCPCQKQACKAWRECHTVCECPCQKQACKAWRECVNVLVKSKALRYLHTLRAVLAASALDAPMVVSSTRGAECCWHVLTAQQGQIRGSSVTRRLAPQTSQVS